MNVAKCERHGITYVEEYGCSECANPRPKEYAIGIRFVTDKLESPELAKAWILKRLSKAPDRFVVEYVTELGK